MRPLDRLAELVGIESSYYDIWGNLNSLGDDAKRALLSAMGFAVATDAELAAGLSAHEERRWRQVLESAVVLAAEQQPGAVALTLPTELATTTLYWTLIEEQGKRRGGHTRLAALPVVASREVNGQRFEQRTLHLPDALPEGYHRFSVHLERAGGEALAGATTLIVAPPSCYSLDEIIPGGKFWGVATQLYSLRSERNWGMGDFGDLVELAGQAGRMGAAALGLNPLHPLFPANPGNFSPYSPSSRALFNTLYIDVTAVPDFKESPEAQALVNDPTFQSRLAQLRQAELIDYEWVATCKYLVLGRLFANFRQQHLYRQTPRATAFRRFCEEMGQHLERLALFDALYEHFHAQNPDCWTWQDWPAAYRHPDSPEVQAFAREQQVRITYFKYLQWLADEQLAAAAKKAKEAGMAIGLYMDLAVGVDAWGGDAWSEPELLAPGAAIGAPPDLLNRLGQNWGLIPPNPVMLKDYAFAPFIAALRSNMRYAGALRIDHVMSLMRLYWIPPGLPPTAGAYIHYPFWELLRIVALESRRHRCLVIGEDLGTVPEGFRETMAAAGVLSYRVLYFERRSDGSFKGPAEYPEQSLVTISTHDLPPLGGWWTGRDIDWRVRLGLYPNEEMRAEDSAHRPVERQHLIEALIAAGIVTGEIAPELAPSEITASLLAAVHRYLARSRGRLMLVQIEDAIGQEEQMNLPGTSTEHPNWRRKLPIPLEQLFQDERLLTVLAALREERPV
jgi:4-alpha-glucanotransferase